MTMIRLIAFSVCVMLAACGRATEPPAPQPQAPATATSTPEQHGAVSEVRIEPGMLRDLRTTTATVEARRGDELITLLGELAVDERAYAEVGVPVAARVVRLLAGAGDAVSENQPLLELQSIEVGRARSNYLAALGRLTLAESALKRKQDLAAERIAPQREVQEADAEATAARAELRAARAALTSMGLSVPEGGEAESLQA